MTGRKSVLIDRGHSRIGTSPSHSCAEILLSLNVPTAVKLSLAPGCSDAPDGATAIELNVALETVRPVESVTEPTFAVIVIVPGASPETKPDGETVATPRRSGCSGCSRRSVLEELGNAQKVRVGGAVQLTVRVKPPQKARRGRNPATGEEITIAGSPRSSIFARVRWRRPGPRCRRCRKPAGDSPSEICRSGGGAGAPRRERPIQHGCQTLTPGRARSRSPRTKREPRPQQSALLPSFQSSSCTAWVGGLGDSCSKSDGVAGVRHEAAHSCAHPSTVSAVEIPGCEVAARTRGSRDG